MKKNLHFSHDRKALIFRVCSYFTTNVEWKNYSDKKDSLGEVTDYNNGKGFAFVENINKMT